MCRLTISVPPLRARRGGIDEGMRLRMARKFRWTLDAGRMGVRRTVSQTTQKRLTNPRYRNYSPLFISNSWRNLLASTTEERPSRNFATVNVRSQRPSFQWRQAACRVQSNHMPPPILLDVNWRELKSRYFGQSKLKNEQQCIPPKHVT